MLRTLTIGDVARLLLAVGALVLAVWAHAIGNGI
jgi:hypothetical protein